MKTGRPSLLIALAVAALAGTASAFDAFVTMTNGYFFDPASGAPWVPHGIAYQTWNRPLGVWQTHEQIDYDLDEMKKMGANSIRVDFVWQHIEEDGDNQWQWDNYDYLVQAAEARGIRIFALIGYQWPPSWFPDEWYTMHPPEYDSGGIYHAERWPSDIINYEHPDARAQYAEWFQNVCSRYKDSKAIVGWIIGNESGFLGLWSGLLDGYDPWCEQEFREWCEAKYGTISVANSYWGSSYTNFSDLAFPNEYTAYGVEGAIWADAVQWREDAIGGFTALGAKAAKAADTNHLISYSTVGMQWGEEDWRYHAEDRGKITAACIATNAPIDFFSVNNYPWSILGHESQNGHWGISFTKKVSGVPVLYSETGFTSSETMWPGMNEQRQGPLIRNSLWESLEAGAIGTHIFAWHDRPYITDREKGFGILYANRVIKPAFWVSQDTFTLMKQVDLAAHLYASEDPTPDIAFLWTAANDSQYNRYECEMQQIAGALERLGYEPNFIDFDELGSGAYTNYKVIILPRNMRVDGVVSNSGGMGVLEFLRKVVISNGIHIIASGDLPGLQDFHGRPQTNFVDQLRELFGVDASDIGGYEVPQRTKEYVSWYWAPIDVRFTTNAAGPLTNGWTYRPYTWKYSDEIQLANGGILWAEMDSRRNKGFETGPYSSTNLPEWSTWGTYSNEDHWGWAMDGSNMVHLWGDSGIWQDLPVLPFQRHTFSSYLRSNDTDPLRGGHYATLAIEWLDKGGTNLGTNAATCLEGATPGNSWVQYKVDAFAPSNAYTARHIIRIAGSVSNSPNLVSNPGLLGSGSYPTDWSGWNTNNYDADAGTYRSASPSWAFWWDSGIWQDITNGFVGGDEVTFSGYLYTPSWDRLRNGDKRGEIQLEIYSNSTLMTTWTAAPAVTSNSAADTWIYAEGTGAVPAGATAARLVVRCAGSTGDGRFLADDVAVTNLSPGGALYVDNYRWSPAVVVKEHGAGSGKAAIFLYGAGDNKPDGDEDTQPDIYLWRWRYEVFGALVSNYFGVEPALTLSGTNACYALAEYRTCTNGSVLMQVKNYLYDTNFPATPTSLGGGATQTFTVSSSLLVGKTIRAFDQCRVIETNCDGTFQIDLGPDGQDMILASAPSTNERLVQIVNTPSVMHPFGDQCYGLTVKYDTAGATGLVLKIAFREVGDNGDGVTNEIYQVLSTNTLTESDTPIFGAGQHMFWMWIPDPDANDPDYLSTPDGGQYEFIAWLEDGTSNTMAASVPNTTRLEWGIAPTATVPTSIVKGQTTNIPVEWEDLYEQLFWQNTPLSRGNAFPNRVAVFRSTKTEAQYPGHFDRANAVLDWLETLGYEPANRQDLSFDNVWVMPLGTGTSSASAANFSDDMESGTNGWAADGLWHQGTDQSASPSHSWGYHNGSNYVTGARNYGSLVTPWITLSNAAAGASLRFASWYETEDSGTAWDRKYVFISTNGTSWTELLRVSGTSCTWVSYAADLSPWAGRTVKLKFYFDTIDGQQNGFRGWRVDDVQVMALDGDRADLFFDDMESTTNWVADGLWRAATNRTTSGTNAWTYNDGTDYDTGARNAGSIVSKWIDLSDAGTALLTFRSWYRTEDAGLSYDRKLVYVTTNGTDWTRLLQLSGPMEQWTEESYDLSAYAGRPVRLRFAFDTIDRLNNGYEGWSVDDVRISTLDGAGTAAFSESAEGGTNEWTATGLWHVATDLCHSASHAWAFNDGSTYQTGWRISGELVSRWIDLAAASGAALEFRSWYETEDAGTTWDRKVVFVSTNGTDWTQVRQISGPNRQWTAQTLDLSAYAGQKIRLKFSFDSVDAAYNAYRGWYVDDILVKIVGSSFAFIDSFAEPGFPADWTRAAGAGNWASANGSLRAWRIGNDDNILCAGDASWSNYIVNADIRYNTKGPYFSDAEVYCRYQDRDNFIKVAIHNFYEFWRLKYTVRAATNTVEQYWVYSFSKTNAPEEGAWYNLRIRCQTNTFTVFFNGEEMGSFARTNFPSGKIALGTKATQLGIWEPSKAYFLIDDDEYSYQGSSTLGEPLNLDWGYLNQFFAMLVLPGVYVMNDTEASNIGTWLTNGFFSLLATDGGVAMKDETGAYDTGRVEPLFGVGTAVSAVGGLQKVTIGTNVHYATLDYSEDDEIPLAGSAQAWTGLADPMAAGLGVMDNGASNAPALICNVITQRADSPPKVFCFNYAVDTGGQLTNDSRQLARRAFEWLQGQTYRLCLELKWVVNPTNPNLDAVVFSTNFWTLNGWGTNDLTVNIPMDNCMTGTNLYWVMYTFPWNASNAWTSHQGFYSAANEGIFTTLDGIGLQLMGITDNAFAGRDWDMWVAYNTKGSNFVAHFGVQDRGKLTDEDNFEDGDYAGWTVAPDANVEWCVSNGALRATVVGAGGYATITRDGLAATGRNITVEYNVRFTGAATNAGDGGVVYGGVPLCVTPQACGWRDAVTNLYTNNLPVTGQWHHVVLSVRDGDPYWNSDLFVDSRPVFLDEPVEAAEFGSGGVGFLSPYYGGYVEWDNVRIVDEEYSLTTQAVSGVHTPTNANFWPSVPDYDPDWWEHEGTTLGGRYQWYIYFRGEGVHGYTQTKVWFAPRLMVEATNFPTQLTAGDAVQVPVEWENLGTNEVPAYLTIHLQNPFTDVTYTTNTFLITNAWGTMLCDVDLPAGLPSANDYLWSAYMYPTGAADGWLERIGSDDTFRFDALGQAVEAETPIAAGFNGTVYSDQGIPAGFDIGTWAGGSSVFNSTNVDVTAPEGSEDFYTWGTDYAGWDVHRLSGGEDMTLYSNGYLKFFLKSTQNMKIELRGPQATASFVYVPTTTDTWSEITIPITNFPSVVLSNMYSLFSMTSPGFVGTTSYVDNIRWTKE